jgi:hypothetical protein
MTFKRVLGALLLACGSFAAAGPAPTGFPFSDETLRYALNMPGGPKLGEGRMTAKRTAGMSGWDFQLTLDAPVPMFAIHDVYSSHSTSDYCSAEFSKKFEHGQRKTSEKEAIDRSHGTAVRTTLIIPGAGKSEFSVPDCIKDGLTMLMYTRKEMGQGRVPAAQRILFGSMYDAQFTYTGPVTVEDAGKPVTADRLLCSLKGPKSNLEIEILFARDAARTPLQMRLPLAVGSFSLELVR